MVELVFLAIFGRLLGWGRGPIIVTRRVAADDAVLRGLLSDAATQRRLLAPRASVAVKRSRTPRVLTAELRFCARTVAWITWILTPGRGTTEVDVAVQLESRRLVTRLVVLLGGRRWIARRLEIALAALAAMSARAAEDLIALPAADVVPAARRAPGADAPLQVEHAVNG